MIWLVAAVAAHVSNATVFLIDKALLGTTSRISQPARYAAYSGLVAAGAGALLLIAFTPLTSFIAGWSLVAGSCWVAALWCFFYALKYGESSRIVPLTGSIVPIVTLLGATAVLGERLPLHAIVGVVFLIAGGALLSVPLRGVSALSPAVIAAALGSGALFAAHFTTMKHIYAYVPSFIGAFAYSRIAVAVVALGLLASVSLHATAAPPRARATTQRSLPLALWFIGSKLIAMVALLLQNYAISVGSVTVVNALQGTQYLVLLGVALLVSRSWPKVLQEELHRVALWQKVGGITLVSSGLIAIVVV